MGKTIAKAASWTAWGSLVVSLAGGCCAGATALAAWIVFGLPLGGGDLATTATVGILVGACVGAFGGLIGGSVAHVAGGDQRDVFEAVVAAGLSLGVSAGFGAKSLHGSAQLGGCCWPPSSGQVLILC